MTQFSETDLWLVAAIILVLGVAGGLLLRAVNDREEAGLFAGRRTSARLVARSAAGGLGCGIQGFGVLLFALGGVTFFSVVGPLLCWPLAAWLLSYGSRQARWLECSACSGRVADRRATVCPHCRSAF